MSKQRTLLQPILLDNLQLWLSTRMEHTAKHVSVSEFIFTAKTRTVSCVLIGFRLPLCRSVSQMSVSCCVVFRTCSHIFFFAGCVFDLFTACNRDRWGKCLMLLCFWCEYFLAPAKCFVSVLFVFWISFEMARQENHEKKEYHEVPLSHSGSVGSSTRLWCGEGVQNSLVWASLVFPDIAVLVCLFCEILASRQDDAHVHQACFLLPVDRFLSFTMQLPRIVLCFCLIPQRLVPVVFRWFEEVAPPLTFAQFWATEIWATKQITSGSINGGHANTHFSVKTNLKKHDLLSHFEFVWGEVAMHSGSSNHRELHWAILTSLSCWWREWIVTLFCPCVLNAFLLLFWTSLRVSPGCYCLSWNHLRLFFFELKTVLSWAPVFQTLELPKIKVIFLCRLGSPHSSTTANVSRKTWRNPVLRPPLLRPESEHICLFAGYFSKLKFDPLSKMG